MKISLFTKSPMLPLAAAAAVLLALPALAASTAPSRFDPLQTFAPYSYPQPATAYRSASGKPGPLFWQNRAGYQIKATLDPAARLLSGSEVISCTDSTAPSEPMHRDGSST